MNGRHWQQVKVFTDLAPHLIENSSLAIGFFDGVHPGHQEVIQQAIRHSRESGAVPAIVTFREHPRTLTLGKSPPLLTLPEQRLALFEAMGIKAVLLLSFTEDLCRLSPEDYVRNVLVNSMDARFISIGYNHRFGRNREGTPQLLEELGKRFNFTIAVTGEILIDGQEVSSSRIREKLREGQVREAEKLLGRPYSIIGQIVKGYQRGRTLGFPTANIECPEELIVPKIGVYAGWLEVKGEQEQLLPCVINIGYRPTIHDHAQLSIEAHALDFSGNLYDKQVALHFLDRLREEIKFPDLDLLKKQIEQDCQRSRQLLQDRQNNQHLIKLN